MQRMLDAGVATRRGIMCAHREPAYPPDTWACQTRLTDRCGCPPGACERLTHSEQAQDHAIILPLFPQMTADEQDQVADALRDALAAEARAPRGTPA